MNRKKAIFFMLISLIIAIIILVITLVKDRKSLIGYGLMGGFLVVALVFYSIYRINDSITKYRKLELESFIKNHPELNIISFDINKSNAYIQMANNDSLVYISIFNKRLYMDVFTKEESKKLEYLEQLEDESLKREGFMELMKEKKGITLYIKNLSAEDIFIKVKANL